MPHKSFHHMRAHRVNCVQCTQPNTQRSVFNCIVVQFLGFFAAAVFLLFGLLSDSSFLSSVIELLLDDSALIFGSLFSSLLHCVVSLQFWSAVPFAVSGALVCFALRCTFVRCTRQCQARSSEHAKATTPTKRAHNSFGKGAERKTEPCHVKVF